MKKEVLAIYENIANAKIGEQVGTQCKKGINWGQSVESLLVDQGYKTGKHYTTSFDWGTCNTFVHKLTEIKPYKAPVHDIKPGDIFYNSWGWEQTNIDFYQVVSTTAKTITIRRIMENNTEYNAYQLTGKKRPVADCFKCEAELRKIPYFCRGEWGINFENGSGAKWDGKPKDFSCYA